MNSPTNTETCKERLKKFTRNCRAFGGAGRGSPITLPRSFPACMSVGLYFKSLGESPLAKISVDGSLPGNKKTGPRPKLGLVCHVIAAYEIFFGLGGSNASNYIYIRGVKSSEHLPKCT